MLWVAADRLQKLDLTFFQLMSSATRSHGDQLGNLVQW